MIAAILSSFLSDVMIFLGFGGDIFSPTPKVALERLRNLQRVTYSIWDLDKFDRRSYQSDILSYAVRSNYFINQGLTIDLIEDQLNVYTSMGKFFGISTLGSLYLFGVIRSVGAIKLSDMYDYHQIVAVSTENSGIKGLELAKLRLEVICNIKRTCPISPTSFEKMFTNIWAHTENDKEMLEASRAILEEYKELQPV